MTVFSEGKRTREGPAKAGEGRFAYLDSSARPEAATCRETIEQWVQDYPEDKLAHWLGDFRSNDDGQHSSAFFELFLIQFFKANGWNVLEVEPNIEGVRGNPDFLIERPDGLKVVVEAIEPNDLSVEARGKAKLIADIKDAINALKISDHYLMLDAIKAPSQAINKARLISALNDWLGTRPSDQDIFEYEDKGAIVHLRVYHRPGRDVDSPHYRAIGVEMGGVSVSTPGDHVKRGLERKASKYRELEFPYIIALNARGFQDTEDDYLAATYGSQAVRISIGPAGESGESEWFRNPDGLFNDGGKPRKRHVSAALLFNGVAPWNWQDRRSCIIHNAHADRPLGDLSFGGDAFVAINGRLERVGGGQVGDVLGQAIG